LDLDLAEFEMKEAKTAYLERDALGFGKSTEIQPNDQKKVFFWTFFLLIVLCLCPSTSTDGCVLSLRAIGQLFHQLPCKYFLRVNK